jgi:hypothetical protein
MFRREAMRLRLLCEPNVTAGHGFAKKPNVDAYQEAMVQFWRSFLLA